MDLTSSRWARINEVFDVVIAAEPAQRDELLAAMASGDPALMTEVRSLVAAAERSGEVFDAGAIEALSATEVQALLSARSLVGRQLGHYRVTREIGRGGMGIVYEGVRIDDQFEQRVAIKTLAIGFDRPELVWRFRRERQILAGLSHPNISALYDGGTTEDGIPYLVMEFVSGRPIDEWCDSQHLSIPQRLDLFRQVCAAVQFAHGKLVVHRDLKPSNILVTDDGVVKLLDFGIAKLLTPEHVDTLVTHDGMAPLTTAYASPEQARGEDITTAADVYSLGMVLYRLLTGAAPYNIEYKSRGEALAILSTQPPRVPSESAGEIHALNCGMDNARRLRTTLAGELDAIVLMTLRKEPERRYSDVAALSHDLLRFLKGRPVHARPDTLGYRMRKFVQRERTFVAAATVAMAALAGGTIFSLRAADIAREEARRATRMSEYLRAIVGAADPSHYSTFRSGRTDVTLAEVLDSTRARVERDLVDEPRVRADMYWTLGTAFRVFNKHDVAGLLLDSARILHARTLGDNSLEVARDVHFAALIHQETGRSDLAVDGLRDALARYRRLPAPPDTEVTDVLGSLGQALGVGMQKVDEGSALLREAELREASSARPRWALLGFAQSALATTLAQGPDADAADSAYARAIASFMRDSARTSADLAFALVNWGTMLGRRGQYVRAAALKREGLRRTQAVHGPSHSITAIFQQRLGEELVMLDSLTAARLVVDSAIAIHEAGIPTNHRELCAALRLRGAIETKAGNFDAAARTLARARALLDSMGNVRIVPEIGVLTEYSRLHEARGRTTDARRELERAYALAREQFGPASVFTLASIGRLAQFEMRHGDTVRAASLRADSVTASSGK